MSLENDPFDTQPAPLPPQPPPELEPQPTGQYTGAYDEPRSIRPRVPIAVWIGLGILAVALCLAVILLVILLTQGGGGGQVRPTATPLPPQPTVISIPDIVSGGTLVALQGTNMRPNDLVVFYLRDPARPTEPILQIGTQQTDASGRFTWSFTYPSDPRWTSISAASVIVQSTATGGYLTVPLRVVPGGAGTIVVPTRVPPTWTPVPTGIIPTPTSPPVIYPTLTQTPNPNEWRGEYFNNQSMQGYPVMVRNDPSVNVDWAYGSPAPNIPVDYFSARWTRTFMFDGGMYRFTARADDGLRVWLDSTLIIDEWHTATPNTYLKDINVPAGQHVLRVEYYEGVGTAYVNFNFDRVTSYPDWKGDYFNNQFLSGAPVYIRNDAAVSFDWSSNTAPAPGVPSSNFSVRWTRTVEFAPGSYRFTIRVNGGTNLLIDGNLVIGQWTNNINGTFTADYTLSSGSHTFEIDYYNISGSAYVWFTYQPLTGSSADWSGNYFANDRWSGIPTLVRFDPNINFDWSTASPGPLLPVDHFSARWTRVVNLPAAGLYRIDVTVDDGVRVYVDNGLIMDQVKESSAVNYTAQVQLTQGNHEVRVEYVEYSGQSVMKFNLTPVNVFVTPTPAPPTATFTPTPFVPPTSTFTPQPPATATVQPAPVINSFTAQPPQVTVGAQCVTLTWSTSNAISPIALEVNGQTVQTNLPTTGQANHCPTTPGTQAYTLIITSSPYYGPVSATQTVQAVSPSTVTPTPTPTPTPTVGVQPL